jgi:hypothetical protein
MLASGFSLDNENSNAVIYRKNYTKERHFNALVWFDTFREKPEIMGNNHEQCI